MSITIKINPNGPYVIQSELSEVKLIDESGNEFTPAKKALCRCGGSVVKPYCDGTHSKIGFKGASEAVQGE